MERTAAEAIALTVVEGESATLMADQGESSWSFVVDGATVVKIARSPDVAARMTREASVLRVVAEHWSIPVPRATVTELAGGLAAMTYDWLPGRPLTRADLDDDPALLASLFDAVDALHAIPVGAAADVLGVPASTDAWRAHHRQMWTTIVDTAGPVLPAGLLERLHGIARAAFEGDADFTASLVHGDLGIEHVLVDRGQITGVIDFEYALIGDPLQDHVALGNGQSYVESGRAGSIRDAEARLAYYAVFGPAAAAAHGVRTNDPELIRGATAVVERVAGRAHA